MIWNIKINLVKMKVKLRSNIGILSLKLLELSAFDRYYVANAPRF